MKLLGNTAPWSLCTRHVLHAGNRCFLEQVLGSDCRHSNSQIFRHLRKATEVTIFYMYIYVLYIVYIDLLLLIT